MMSTRFGADVIRSTGSIATPMSRGRTDRVARDRRDPAGVWARALPRARDTIACAAGGARPSPQTVDAAPIIGDGGAVMGQDDQGATRSAGGSTDAASDASAPPDSTPASGPGAPDAPSRPMGRRARYELLGEHARGGLGRIMRAHDYDLDRVVALKELLADSPTDAARFAREVRLTARLEHPGIVPIHDTGHHANDGRRFYTMKLVGGASLRDLIARCAGLDERLALLPHVLAIADAVAYAHSRGIIHRDLKPANVIVGEFGETIVIDWGLAKELDVPADAVAGGAVAAGGDDDDVTVAGAVVGTPAFMAPEQARGDAVDARADVYAIGAITYEVLAGCGPYDGPRGSDVLRQLRAGPPPPVRQREPRVPVDLAAIVDKAMARAPADRYPTARELAGDLRRLEAGRRVSARAYRWWEPSLRWLRRHWLIAAVTMAFVVAGAIGLAVALRREQGLRRVAELERGRAENQTLTLLEDQARRELDAGRPHRAAVLLASALRRAPDRLPLRWLLSQAAPALRGHVRTLVGHQADVVTTAFSPDGATLVTGSSDKTVRLWDVASGVERAVLAGHERSLEDVAWSPDGALLASADARGIRIWRADGTLVRALSTGAYRIGFAPDGARLYGGGVDGRVRGWDVATGAAHELPQEHTRRLSTITFDGAGHLVTAAWDGRIVVWDLATLSRVRVVDDHRAQLELVRFSADGALVLTGDEEGTLHVRDGGTFEILHTLRLSSAAHATNAWFAAGGTTILTTSADGSLRTWHATSGDVLGISDVVPEGKLFDTDLSPDGTLVAVASLRQVDVVAPPGAGDLRLFDGARHEDVFYDPGALSADGRWLAVSRQRRDRSNRIRLFETATGAVVAEWPEDGNPYSLALSPDGSRVVTGDLDGLPPRLRDARTGALIATLLGHGKTVVNVAFSPDGAWIATASYDQTVRLWRARDGAPVAPVIVPPAWPTAVAFDPASARLAVADERGGVTLYDRASGAELDRFAAHATWIEDVEFSADGARLVTACRQEHAARIWTLGADLAPIALVGHADNLQRGSFSPDGALVATSSVDQSARIWDAQTGELLRTLPGPVGTAAFSPDGRTLITTGERDYAVAWSLAIDHRPAAVLAAEVEAASPWRLDEGRLVLKRPVAP